MFNENETKIYCGYNNENCKKMASTFGAILGFIIGFLQLQVNRFKRYVYYRNFYILLTECKFNDIYQDYGHLYN